MTAVTTVGFGQIGGAGAAEVALTKSPSSHAMCSNTPRSEAMRGPCATVAMCATVCGKGQYSRWP